MKSQNYIGKGLLVVSFLLLLSTQLFAQQIQYTMPAEWKEHEGTWLVWPHDFTYGPGTKEKFEPAWIEMTRQLVKGENVHIVAYNQDEKDRIVQLLTDSGVVQNKVDFFIHPNDDFWVRDNGPIFVKDGNGEQLLTDWGFNGWGNDAPFTLDDQIPSLIASDIDVPAIDLSAMILEGGAIDVDGNGTLMATKSSITGDGRNAGLTDEQIEEYLTTNLGVTHFIWLDGKYGGSLDITDSHIDGFAKFHDSSTIVTMNNSDLAYWFVSQVDRNILYNATNANGNPYNHVYLPLTKNKVKTTWGLSTGSKADYINYYVGNDVVLVPTYNDPNDNIAISIIEGLYPDKEVVGIDSRNLFYWGGMIHCVTQQQPVQACSLIASMDATGTVTACKGTAVTLTCNNTAAGTAYQWRKNSDGISGATSQTYTNTQDEASFDVMVTTPNNCSDISEAVFIDRIAKPSATITAQGNLDICNTGSVVLKANAGNNYQYKWKKNNVNIAGATNQLYTATVKGNYKVEVSNQNGCSKTSKVTAVISSCRNGEIEESPELSLYPNPASGLIYISTSLEGGVLHITNSLGEVVLEKKIIEQHQTVDISNLASGMYVIRIISGDVEQTKKLVKE